MVRQCANGLVSDQMQDVPLQTVHPLIRRQEAPLSTSVPFQKPLYYPFCNIENPNEQI